MDPIEAVLALRDAGSLPETESDGRFARRVADADVSQRDEYVRAYAWFVCHRVTDRLAAIGVEFHDVPIPVDYDAARVVEALGTQARREAERSPSGAGVDVTDGGFVVAFSYSKRRVDDMKLIPGRRWDPDTKVWLAPLSEGAKVRRFAETHRVPITPSAREALDAADADGAYHLFVDDDHRHLIYRGGYVAEVIEAIRAVPGRKYQAATKEWWFPIRQADHVERIAAAFGLVAHPMVAPLLAQWSDDAEEMRRLSRAEDVAADTVELARPLYGYQAVAPVYAEKAGWRVILGDEPGLGKSVQALAVCEAADRWPVVVVCPTVMEIGWQREIEATVPHRTAARLTGKKATHLIGGADYLIVGWPVLADWLNVLLSAGAGGAIFDESHYAKSSKAARTKAAKALVGVGTRDRPRATLGGAVPSDGPVLCLSGTFVVNDASEAIEPLKILGRIGEFGGEHGFRVRYCGLGDLPERARRERHRELHERLRASCLLRRKKADVLADLPAKRRAFLWIEGDPAALRDYRRAEARLLEYLAAKAREEAVKVGADPDSAAVMARMRAAGAEHLVQINVLRQLAAKAKVPAAIEWAETFLEGSDDSLVVYAHHRDIVDEVAAALGAGKIMGGMTAASRQTTIDGFQAGAHRSVALAIQAAGVGITLTAASTGLFLEQAWNPGTLTQAEDRMHRIGQVESVTAFYMLTEGTIDVDMVELIERKRKEVDDVTDGGDADSWDTATADDPAEVLAASGSVAGDLIERLTRRALGDNNR